MKNLNARTKKLLAIAGIVIVVIVAGVLFMGPADDLFGTTVIHISPQNPTIAVGQTINMSINTVSDCVWSVPSENVVHIMVGSGPMGEGAWGVAITGTKNAYVQAVAPGQVVISAKCFSANRSTTVTVK